MTDIVSHGRGGEEKDQGLLEKGHNFEAGDLQPSLRKANYENEMKERWNSIGGKINEKQMV